MVDLNLVNAKIHLPGRLFEGGVSIDGGKIVKVGRETNLPKSSRIDNLEGLLLFPGLIDAHVHLRDLELAYKEDFYTGTCAAAAGGFTTVLDMPNTQPVTDSRERLREKMAAASTKIVVNVGFYTTFPPEVGMMGGMVEEGAVAFKGHLHMPWSRLNLGDGRVLTSVISEASRLGSVAAFHAEDKATVESIEGRLKAENRRRPEDFLTAHNIEAEVKAVDSVLNALGAMGRVHFCHISSAASLASIKKARERGLKITCEVTPHHLLLTDSAVKRLGGLAITAPPLRDAKEARALWMALSAGTIDILASDHAPHRLEDKRHSDIWAVSPGIPGLETTLPLILTKVMKNEIALGDVVRVLAEGPAGIFNLEGKGKILEGYDADLTVIDLKKEHKIDVADFHSKAKYSPFDGWEVRGVAVRSYVAGSLVMEDGVILAKGGSGGIVKGRASSNPSAPGGHI